jgi:hypothetical protein
MTRRDFLLGWAFQLHCRIWQNEVWLGKRFPVAFISPVWCLDNGGCVTKGSVVQG